MEAATREIASQLAANAVQQAEDAIMASAKAARGKGDYHGIGQGSS